MATFITIGYGDEAGYERTTTQAKDAAHVHDAWLVERGAIVGIVGSPIQVRNHQNRGTRTDEGAYLKSDLAIAGFSLIEASTREEAVELVAKTPCVVAYGVIEVWPLIVPSDNERLKGTWRFGLMDIQFVTSVAPIVRDAEASRSFYANALGLVFEGQEGDYVFTHELAGTKHFGLWPLSDAANACFGTTEWPLDIPAPQASIEFGVADVAAAAAELTAKGYRLIHGARTEP